MRRVLFALLLASCRAPVLEETTVQPLRVEPAQLTFAPTWVGASQRRSVTLLNPNRVPLDVELSVAPPFAVDAGLRLEGGGEATVEVRFTPTSEGPVSEVLSITAQGHVEVLVTGEGVAVPECSAAAACHRVAFDLERGVCADELLADGTDCTSSFACFTQASCHAGRCEGRLISACDDGDLCTVDGCGPAGCTRTPRVCAVSDPCRIPTCDPVLGCRDVAVEDGIACGPSRCEDAFICLGGTCQQVPAPNAATDCRYVDVTAGRSASCGLTRGGEVKCWGRAHAPWREPALTNIVPGTLVAERWTCGVRADGSVVCTTAGWRGSLPAETVVVPFTRPARRLATFDEQVCATLDDESAECWTSGADASVRFFDGGAATDLALTARAGVSSQTELCVLTPDAGLRCARNQAATTTEPVVAFTAVRGDELLALTATGERWCGASRCPEPTDVLGGTNGLRCSARGTGVRCEYGDGRTWTDTLDAGVTRLTSSINNAQLCALTTDGHVWCAHSNLFAAAGDYSVAPMEVVSVNLGATAAFAVNAGWTWVAVDGGLQSFGLGGPPFVPLPRDVVPTALGGAPNGSAWVIIERDGGVWTQGRQVALPEAATAIARQRVLAGGHAWDVASGTAVDLGPALSISGAELIDADGGLSFSAPGLPPLRQLSERASRQQGCGLTRAGGAVCWVALGDGGLAVEPITGLRPGATRLSADLGIGCVVVPPSGVQCWGAAGESLPSGTQVSSRTRAVDVVVGEEVVSLSVVFRHVCAVTRSGRLVCWGDNQHGQLGVPSLINAERFLPVPW
ncbi:MAG: hypothetical protein ACOZQL_02955 [Myxococcota bacterium]